MNSYQQEWLASLQVRIGQLVGVKHDLIKIQSGDHLRDALIRLGVALAQLSRPAAVSGMTRRQREALEFVEGYIAVYGVSPSYDEIAAELGVASRSVVHRIIHGLVDRGFISMRPSLPRSIEVLRSLRDQPSEAA